MSKTLTVTLNGDRFPARIGDNLLDAALSQGVDFPHDCRVGHCGTCTVTVTQGITTGGETGCRGFVKACQARVFSDVELALEEMPEPVRINAILSELRDIADGIVEVTITPLQRFEFLPGQYVRLQFKGYPARSFSPTACMDYGRFGHMLRFHIKKVAGGAVTPSLGTDISPAHPLRIEGPFGTAFLRPHRQERLVLIGTGTGFAPIWSVAAAALRENPEREMVLVAGSRDVGSFYMAEALAWAARHPNVTIVPVVDSFEGTATIFKQGSVVDHLPVLDVSDIVYAAGAPRMVEAVAKEVEKTGAIFYSDPFETQAPASARNISAGETRILPRFAALSKAG